jgi:hypothetical protein
MLISISPVVEGSGILGSDNHNFATFAMYPNPANNSVFLNFPNSAERQLVISDVTGKKIISEVIQGNSNQVDLTGLAGGVYVVEVRFNGFVHRKKLIKE